jgi:hypothetical protein
MYTTKLSFMFDDYVLLNEKTRYSDFIQNKNSPFFSLLLNRFRCFHFLQISSKHLPPAAKDGLSAAWSVLGHKISHQYKQGTGNGSHRRGGTYHALTKELRKHSRE